jgi:hypothetical protein
MQAVSWLSNWGSGPVLHEGMYPSAMAHRFLPTATVVFHSSLNGSLCCALTLSVGGPNEPTGDGAGHAIEAGLLPQPR